jgi:hypothetical protein
MVFNFGLAHRLKSTRPDVKGQLRTPDASRLQLSEKLGREMKSGSRRRNSSAPGSIDCLIALPIQCLRGALALHIGRQRRLPEGFKSRKEITTMLKLKPETSTPNIADHLRRHVVAKTKPATYPRFLRGIDQGDPETSAGFWKTLQQEHFDLATAVLLPMQSSGKDFRIVEHEEIARVEKLAQVGKNTVNYLAGVAPEHKQARFLTFAAGKRRDKLVRKFVIEFFQIHEGSTPGLTERGANLEERRHPLVASLPFKSFKSFNPFKTF